MRKAVLAAILPCACWAQSNLTTPVSVLPLVDHSAAGVLRLYDSTKTDWAAWQFNTFTAPSSSLGMVIQDNTTPTTSYGLSLTTSAGADYFHIFGGGDAAAPGLVVANGGIQVTPTGSAFSGIVVSQAQNASGIESNITSSGLSAFLGTSTASAATLRMTNSHSSGIAGYFSAATAVEADGEARPSTDVTYSLGDPSFRWSALYANGATLSSLGGVSATAPVCSNNSGLLFTSGCPSAGTSYWSLSVSDLSPTGAYNVVPNGGGGTLGTAATNWPNAYIGTVAVFSSVAFENTVPSIAERLGYDSSTGGVAFVSPTATRLFGVLPTGGALSYGDLDPSTNNTYNLGDAVTPLRWKKVATVDLDISGTCTGCPAGYFGLSGSDLSPTGAYNIIPNGGGGTLGTAASNWATANIGTVVVYSSIAFDNSVPSVVQRLGYDSGTGGTSFVNNLSQRVFGITQTGGAISYGDLLPSANNSWNLGDTTTPLRWKKIATVDIDISGTCTGCPAGGTVTSVATSGPITGGTITTTGTIGCSTCLVTGGGQTITGIDTFTAGLTVNGGTLTTNSIVPTVTNTWAIGGSSLYYASSYINVYYVGTGTGDGIYVGFTEVLDNNKNLLNLENVTPLADNAYALGSNSLGWSALYAQTANIGKSNSDTSTIYIGSSGNFYDRPIGASSGVSCSGVANGWMAVTSDDYVVVCLNTGTRYRAALASY